MDLTDVVLRDPLVPDCDATFPSLPQGRSESYSCTIVVGDEETETRVYLDDFDPQAFDGNDGSHDFSGPWVEYDVAGVGPVSGNVIVGSNNKLWLDDYPNTGTEPSAARHADLQGALSAVLAFDWSTHSGVESDDKVVVEISSDGGASYATLDTFTGFSGSQSGYEEYDILAYATGETMVRFRIENKYGGENETFKVDNFQIRAEIGGSAGDFTNEICASASGGGRTVSDCDTSSIVIEEGQAAVDIRKQEEGEDSRTFGPGNEVEFDIAVTNTGTVDLRDVVVTDPLVPDCDYWIGDLAVGATKTYSCLIALDEVEATRVFRDQFDTPAYDNDDGSHRFSGPWVEYDIVGEGPADGNVLVGGDYMLWLDDYPNTDTEPSAARTADLSGAVDATLAFDWSTHSGVDADDEVVVEVSSDGGVHYDQLKVFTGFSGSESGHEEFDISAYASELTTVRFRVTNKYGGDNETFKVDNLEILAHLDGEKGFTNEACVSAQGGLETVGDCDTSTVVLEEDESEPCGSLVQEAEDGFLSGDFEIAWRRNASGGAFIQVPNGVGNNWDGSDHTGSGAEFCFEVREAGTYRVTGRVTASSDEDDSLWVEIDGQPRGGYLWDTLQTRWFGYDDVSDRGGADPVEVYLEPGAHTVGFYLREDGTGLDRVSLSKVD